MLTMDAKSKKMCSDALAMVIGTGSVTLVHKSGRTEPISYENWGEEAPALVEGAFVEAIMCHDPIIKLFQ